MLANRELVSPVTSEKIRDGAVCTPVMLLESRAGRDRMKICYEISYMLVYTERNLRVTWKTLTKSETSQSPLMYASANPKSPKVTNLNQKVSLMTRISAASTSSLASGGKVYTPWSVRIRSFPYLMDWFIIARIAARAVETIGPYDKEVNVEVKRFVTLSAIDSSDDV